MSTPRNNKNFFLFPLELNTFFGGRRDRKIALWEPESRTERISSQKDDDDDFQEASLLGSHWTSSPTPVKFWAAIKTLFPPPSRVLISIGVKMKIPFFQYREKGRENILWVGRDDEIGSVTGADTQKRRRWTDVPDWKREWYGWTNSLFTQSLPPHTHSLTALHWTDWPTTLTKKWNPWENIPQITRTGKSVYSLKAKMGGNNSLLSIPQPLICAKQRKIYYDHRVVAGRRTYALYNSGQRTQIREENTSLWITSPRLNCLTSIVTAAAGRRRERPRLPYLSEAVGCFLRVSQSVRPSVWRLLASTPKLLRTRRLDRQTEFWQQTVDGELRTIW